MRSFAQAQFGKGRIQALWAFNNCVNWSAMMRSSPGCNIKEFIDKPWSEALKMIEGSDFFKIAPASLGVMAICRWSHVIRRCGTWLAMVGAGKSVATPETDFTLVAIRSRRRCHAV